jgi:hypothetical protein
MSQLKELAEWLVRMDEPGSVARQTVTLTRIIERAKDALAADAKDRRAVPVAAEPDAYSDAMNLELRRSIAAQVLEAMDVDEYLITAVREARP